MKLTPKRNYSIIAITFLIINLLIPALPIITVKAPGEQPWWNNDWQYRKPVTISSSQSLTNYDILVTVDTQALVSAGKVNPDGSDIRFVDSLGINLPYWIESPSINTPTTKIWVKLSSISASPTDTTIWMYYGNPSAYAMTNGENTFEFFDDDWSTLTTPSAGNPVHTATQSWWESYVSYPNVFEDTSFADRPRFHMLFDGHGVIGHAKGYAWSTDLLTWTEYNANPYPPNPILGTGYTGNAACAWGDPIKVGSKYYLYYSRGPGTIYRAESTDLLTWSNLQAIIDPTHTTTFGVGAAILKQGDGITPITVDGKYWMVYFLAFTPGSMYLASSTDLLNWYPWTQNPMLTPTPGGWDSSGLWTPSFVRFDDKYFIYYQGDGPFGWVTGYAKADAYSGGTPLSPDSTTWTKSPDAVIKHGSGWDSGYCIDPMVRKFGDTYYVFYTGNVANGYAYSSSPEGPWTKLQEGTAPPSDWNKIGTPTVSAGILVLTSGSGITSASTYPYSALEYRANFVGSAQKLKWGGFIQGSTYDRAMISTLKSDTKLHLRNYKSAESAAPLLDTVDDNFHVYEVLWRNGETKAVVDHGAATATLTTEVPTAELPVTFYNYEDSSYSLEVDWVFVRPYSSPEPAASVGAEETYTPPRIEGWSYRRSHVIEHAAGAGTDYQIKIKTYYDVPSGGTGTSKFMNFEKYAGNPLASIPKSGGSGTVHPDVLYFPDGIGGYEYWMTYTPMPEGVEHPSIARSHDGITWTEEEISNPVAVVAPSDADPAMIYVSSLSKWFMVHGPYWSPTQKIALAYSTDGVHWTNYDGDPVNGNTNPVILSGDDAGKQPWETTGTNPSMVAEPNLLYEDGIFYLYYCTFTGGNNNGQVGFATFTWDNIGNNIQSLQRYAYNPVVDIGGCGHADVSKSGSTYYMYVVKGQDLVLLTSTNKITWTNQGVVLQKGPTGAWDSGFIYRSSLVTDGLVNVADFSGDVKLYYSAWGNPDIGLATGRDIPPPPPPPLADNEVSLNRKCRPDFGDIRFTGSDGKTLLDYWMENKVDGDYATFWVKIPDDLSTTDQTIYICYGKSDATSLSNIKATSLWNQGDDFNDNSRDPARWDAFKLQTAHIGGATETNQRLELYIGQSATAAGFVSHDSFLAQNLEMSVLAHNPTIGEVALYLHTTKVEDGMSTSNQDSSDVADHCYRIMLYPAGGQFYAQKRVNGVISDIYSGTAASKENTIRMRVEDGTISFFEGDVQRASDSWALPTRNCYIIIEGWGGATGTDWADNFWIRKYVSPEPTHGAWGNEEAAASITVGCSPSTVYKMGTQTTTISGALTSLSSGLSGKTVVVSYQAGAAGPNDPPVDGTWTTITETTTQAEGQYSYIWDPPETLANGYYWIKATFEGDTGYGPSSKTTGVDLVSNLFVIPEYTAGTILALTVCFAGVAVYRRSKYNRPKTL